MNNECLQSTTINKEYIITKYGCKIEKSIQHSNEPIFILPNKNIYNKNYDQIGTIHDCPMLPNVSCYQTKKEYQKELENWKSTIIKFFKMGFFPVPILHYIPRPEHPLLISREELADPVTRRKFIRNFSPETNPLDPENYIYLIELLTQGKKYNSDELLKYKGFGDTDIYNRYHLNQKCSWGSLLIPRQPDPTLFSNFEDFEISTLKWASIISNMSFIPPSAKQIGELIEINKECSNNLSQPSPPEMELKIKDTFFKPINENNISPNLRKLKDNYNEFIYQKEWKIENNIKNIDTFKPPHSSLSSKEIIVKMENFGIPIQDDPIDFTIMRRNEKSYRDCGFLAINELTTLGIESDHNDYQIFEYLKNDPLKFLLLDFSPNYFAILLKSKLPSENETVLELILKRITIKEIISLSNYSSSLRFIIRLSILLLYVIEEKSIQTQILNLDISYSERFGEILYQLFYSTFCFESFPEEEIIEAINENPFFEEQIIDLSLYFKQAKILNFFLQVILSSKGKYYTSLPFIRNLVYNSFKRISEAIADDSIFPKLLQGFLSKNENVHNFYYRIIRELAYLEYTKIIRALSGYDLLSYIKKGIDSKVPYIVKHTKSIWQILLHTDTSIILQLQILHSQPSMIVSLINSSSKTFREILLSIFTLYRNPNSIYYIPFLYNTYESYFVLLSSDLNNSINLNFFKILLTYCFNDIIYCYKPNKLKNLLNKFMISFASSFRAIEPSHLSQNIQCLKVLMKIQLLDPLSVQILDLWKYILGGMGTKKNIDDNYRQLLWDVFKNAIIYQKQFVHYVLSEQVLINKLDVAFSSLDNNIIICMVKTMTKLSLVFEKVFVDESSISNLTLFFNHLEQPYIFIAGKLLYAYQISKDKPEMLKLHSTIVVFMKLLLKSNKGDVLYKFRRKPEIKNNLNDVFKEIIQINYHQNPKH